MTKTDYITTHEFDLVAITETWLHKSTDKQVINEVVPTGFEKKHVPRPKSREGGGVAMILKSTISVKVLRLHRYRYTRRGNSKSKVYGM